MENLEISDRSLDNQETQLLPEKAFQDALSDLILLDRKREELRLVSGGEEEFDRVTETYLDKCQEVESLYPPFLNRVGLGKHPQKGKLRLFRGTKSSWKPEMDLQYAYWSPLLAVAITYAGNGDVVVAEIDEGMVKLVDDSSKPSEYQTLDPQIVGSARIFIRNLQVVKEDGSLGRYSLFSRLLRLLTSQKAAKQRRQYIPYDAWVKSEQEAAQNISPTSLVVLKYYEPPVSLRDKERAGKSGDGLHGLDHVARVLVMADLLTNEMINSGKLVDRQVVRWAAVLHDICRSSDADHAQLAAETISDDLGKQLGLEQYQLRLLRQIIRLHNHDDNRIVSDDWSLELEILKAADGLDLMRMGIESEDLHFRCQNAYSLLEQARGLSEATNRIPKTENPFQYVLKKAVEMGLITE